MNFNINPASKRAVQTLKKLANKKMLRASQKLKTNLNPSKRDYKKE
jgi:hypothetical protein